MLFAILSEWMSMLSKQDMDNFLKYINGEIWCAANYKPLHNLSLTYLIGTTHSSLSWIHHGYAASFSTASWDQIQTQLLPRSRLLPSP